MTHEACRPNAITPPVLACMCNTRLCYMYTHTRCSHLPLGQHSLYPCIVSAGRQGRWHLPLRTLLCATTSVGVGALPWLRTTSLRKVTHLRVHSIHGMHHASCQSVVSKDGSDNRRKESARGCCVQVKFCVDVKCPRNERCVVAAWCIKLKR